MRNDATFAGFVDFGLETSFDSEHARDGEAPDIGVDHADGETTHGKGGGDIGGHRGLADATLSGSDGQHPGTGGHPIGPGVGLGVQAGRIHGVRLLIGGHLGPVDLDRGDARKALDAHLDFATQLCLERTTGRGEGHGDHDPAIGSDGGSLCHTQLDDVGAEFGIDHAAQGGEHIGFGGQLGHGTDAIGAGFAPVSDRR